MVELLLFGGFHQMSKWKVFNKDKQKEEEVVVEPKESTSIEPDTEEQKEIKYSSTLHTSSSKAKKTAKSYPDQRIWRNVDAIEENIDKLHITHAQKPVTELDKTVDRLLEKKKK